MQIHRKKIDDDQLVQQSGKLMATYLPLIQKNKDTIIRGLVIGGALIVLMGVIFAYQKEAAESSQAELDQALHALNNIAEPVEGSPTPSTDEAQAKFVAFLQANPRGEKAAWAHYHLADLLINAGKTDEGIQHLKDFLAQAPRDGEPIGRMALAFALLKANKVSDAIAEWEALRTRGWSGDLLDFEIALAKLETDKAKSLEIFRQLAAKPESPMAQRAKDQLQLLDPPLTPSLLIQSQPEPSPTQTPIPTETPTATETPTETPTPTQTLTETPTSTITQTETPTSTVTQTEIPTQTPVLAMQEASPTPMPESPTPSVSMPLPESVPATNPTPATTPVESPAAAPQGVLPENSPTAPF